MSRRGLGRGLDALLPVRGESGALEEREGLRLVSIESITTNPNQPREQFEGEALEELAASIEQLGVLQPLLVRSVDDGYQLIAGERRLRASKQAGLTEVPVMVVETDDRGSLERALVENIHRADLNAIEEAAAYKQLIDDAGITQEELAGRLGRNRVTITNSLRLLDLPVEVQALLIERKLTAAHGRALLGLQGNPFQQRVARRAADEALSVRETTELVRKFQQMSGIPDAKDAQRKERVAEVTESQRKLADHLQTRVRVEFGKRKGKITLDFASLDELERLTKVILGDEPGSAESRVTPG